MIKYYKKKKAESSICFAVIQAVEEKIRYGGLKSILYNVNRLKRGHCPN